MDDSAIMYDEAIKSQDDETKTNFKEKKQSVKYKTSIYFSCIFINYYSIIQLLFDCYLIKYRAKQNHLWPFHFTNKLKI